MWHAQRRWSSRLILWKSGCSDPNTAQYCYLFLLCSTLRGRDKWGLPVTRLGQLEPPSSKSWRLWDSWDSWRFREPTLPSDWTHPGTCCLEWACGYQVQSTTAKHSTRTPSDSCLSAFLWLCLWSGRWLLLSFWSHRTAVAAVLWSRHGDLNSGCLPWPWGRC